MAVTKTHPIKSTLKAAIDYICNPDKTDGKLLVSSFGCSAETADIEFAWTRRHAIDKGTNLGRHLIQAFEPGEVMPEEAHRIGMELAREVLGGKYEFALTTHIDRDHVHNHLIFNAVSFQDHKHYHSNKRSYHEICRTSDRICKEHGLSVIVPGQDKGKSYIEHQAEQNGTSYKAKLRAAIDRLLPGCSDLEDLLRRLQREGYELKRGKYISARAPGQERFTRLKTLGADYAEEALTAWIAGRPRPSRQPQQRTGKPSLLIDIQNNFKAQQSAGYKHWATIENLKRAAETLNFLTEHGIGSFEELSERCDGAAAATARVKADLRATEKEMERLTLTISVTSSIGANAGAGPGLDHGNVVKNGIGLGRADRIAQGFQPQGPVLRVLRYAGDALRLGGPEDAAVHPWGKPMSHSTHSGFSAAFSERGFSWWMICADRLAAGDLSRKASGFRVER